MLLVPFLWLFFRLNVTTASFVGGAIGKQDSRLAKKYATVALSVGTVTVFFISVGLLLLNKYIAALYTTDKDVYDLLRKLIFVFAFDLFPDGVMNMCGALLRVCQRQKIAASIYLFRNFVLGIGFALLFGFYFHGGVVGVWWGVFVSCLLFACIHLYLVVQRGLRRGGGDRAETY